MHVDMNPCIMLHLSTLYCKSVEVRMRLWLYGHPV